MFLGAGAGFFAGVSAVAAKKAVQGVRSAAHYAKSFFVSSSSHMPENGGLRDNHATYAEKKGVTLNRTGQ